MASSRVFICALLSIATTAHLVLSAATTTTGYLKVLTHTCTDFAGVSWDDLKYTCAWEHTKLGQKYYNLFIVRTNGGIEKECFCQDGLASYSTWGPLATFSMDIEVTCFTKDGTKALAMRTKFGPTIICPSSPLIWVDTTEGSRSSGSGASQSPGF